MESETGGSEPKSPRMKPTRPQLILPPETPNVYTAGIPMTPGSNMMNPQYVPFNLYQSKAGDFMFNKFNGFKDFTLNATKSGMSFGEKVSFWMYNKVSNLSKQWFTHIFLFFVILLYSVGGAFLFITIEGEHEEVVIKEMREDRLELIRALKEITLRRPEETTEGEWQGDSMRELMAYEDKLIEHWSSKALLAANRGKKIWSFWNAVFYCGTIYTTIGYGHMYPTTTTGRALTIVYALIGIPLFLIILTDFGKLFTRMIKFCWAFVRRVYYTGTCKKARKTTAVKEVIKGAQMMYDLATFRRPSQFQFDKNDPNHPSEISEQPPNIVPHTSDIEAQPDTPAPSNFEIDDEFNLPISVALTILIIYMFAGAVFYLYWEDWDFFASFYFVFISMSTIGFGDYVPRHPICMIVSIIYLVFGLALMSMCINVVQVKLSDTFRQASTKLGATIGLRVNEDDGSITTVPPPSVEIPEVHQNTNNKSA